MLYKNLLLITSFLLFSSCGSDKNHIDQPIGNAIEEVTETPPPKAEEKDGKETTEEEKEEKKVKNKKIEPKKKIEKKKIVEAKRIIDFSHINYLKIEPVNKLKFMVSGERRNQGLQELGLSVEASGKRSGQLKKNILLAEISRQRFSDKTLSGLIEAHIPLSSFWQDDVYFKFYSSIFNQTNAFKIEEASLRFDIEISTPLSSQINQIENIELELWSFDEFQITPQKIESFTLDQNIKPGVKKVVKRLATIKNIAQIERLIKNRSTFFLKLKNYQIDFKNNSTLEQREIFAKNSYALLANSEDLEVIDLKQGFDLLTTLFNRERKNPLLIPFLDSQKEVLTINELFGLGKKMPIDEILVIESKAKNSPIEETHRHLLLQTKSLDFEVFEKEQTLIIDKAMLDNKLNIPILNPGDILSFSISANQVRSPEGLSNRLVQYSYLDDNNITQVGTCTIVEVSLSSKTLERKIQLHEALNGLYLTSSSGSIKLIENPYQAQKVFLGKKGANALLRIKVPENFTNAGPFWLENKTDAKRIIQVGHVKDIDCPKGRNGFKFINHLAEISYISQAEPISFEMTVSRFGLP